jgi:hypothetical protein
MQFYLKCRFTPKLNKRVILRINEISVAKRAEIPFIHNIKKYEDAFYNPALQK